MVEKDVVLTYPREKLTIHKRTTTDDSFTISKQHTGMELSCTDSKRGERVDDEQNIVENSGQLHRQQCYGQFLVDDSFMVPTKSTVHEHVNREWMNDITVGSEVTAIDKTEQPPYNIPKNKYEKSIIQEPVELYMMPERNYERDSLTLAWNPITYKDPQFLVNNANKMYLDEDSNGQENEQGSLGRKQNDKIVK